MSIQYFLDNLKKREKRKITRVEKLEKESQGTMPWADPYGPPYGKKALKVRVDQWIGLILKLFKRGKK